MSQGVKHQTTTKYANFSLLSTPPAVMLGDVDWMVASPQKDNFQHDTCEHNLIWKKGLCRCNQVKMRSHWSRVTLHPLDVRVWCPYEKRLRHGDNGHMTLEAETTALQLEAKKHKEGWWTPEARRKNCPLEPSGRAQPCQHLDLGSVVCRTGIQ